MHTRRANYQPLMNSFNKTEAAVFSCRLCFLRAFPFISLICMGSRAWGLFWHTRCSEEWVETWNKWNWAYVDWGKFCPDWACIHFLLTGRTRRWWWKWPRGNRQHAWWSLWRSVRKCTWVHEVKKVFMYKILFDSLHDFNVKIFSLLNSFKVSFNIIIRLVFKMLAKHIP